MGAPPWVRVLAGLSGKWYDLSLAKPGGWGVFGGVPLSAAEGGRENLGGFAHVYGRKQFIFAIEIDYLAPQNHKFFACGALGW